MNAKNQLKEFIAQSVEIAKKDLAEYEPELSDESIKATGKAVLIKDEGWVELIGASGDTYWFCPTLSLHGTHLVADSIEDAEELMDNKAIRKSI